MNLEDIDIFKTLVAFFVSLITGGGLLVGVKKAVKAAGANGWRVGFEINIAKVDLVKLKKEAASGREAKARADAIATAAEVRVAKAEAAAAHACTRCEALTKERDALALRIAQEGKP